MPPRFQSTLRAVAIAAAVCAACADRSEPARAARPAAPQQEPTAAREAAPAAPSWDEIPAAPSDPVPAAAEESEFAEGASDVPAEAASAPAAPRGRPPSIPGVVTATATGETRVALRWEPSRSDDGRAPSYEVLRPGQPALVVNEPHAEEDGLSPATEHCYAVRARDAAGRRSPPSAPVCVTTSDLTPPTAPSGVVAKATTDRTAEVRWAASADNVGVAGYEIMRGPDVVAVVVRTEGEALALAPARDHCFTVRAFDAAGNRSPSAGPACVTTPDLHPPSTPPSATAIASGETRVAVRWGAATDDVGVVRYEVVRGGKVVGSVPGLELVEAGLEPGVEYCYAVRALDAAGNASAPAGPACARTLDTSPPSAPQELAATASSEDRVALSWRASKDNSPAAISYEVRRGEKVIHLAHANEAKESRLRPFTEYCYTVVAIDGAGNRSAAAGPACTRTLDLTPPSTPGAVALYPATDALLEVSWQPSTDNAGVAGYELLRGEQLVASPSATSQNDGRLQAETRYCYRVRARDGAGNRSQESDPVCGATLARGQPAPPRHVALHRTPKARLSWDAPTGPDVVYRVYQDGRPVGATRFSTYALSGKVEGGHCYTVTVVNGAGRESPRSEETCLSSPGRETAAR